MALKTRPRPNSATRKRQAQHHRKSKFYLKAYHPYLPMFAIVAAGGLVNELWSVSTAVTYADPLQNTRLASLTGSHSLTAVYIVLGITALAFLIFLMTHWYRLHRLLNRGEAFVVAHPWFDIGLVFIITAGVILTRTY